MEEKQCSTCALYVAEQGGCVRNQTREDPTNCCSHWVDEVPICSVCGRPFVPPKMYLFTEDAYILLCPSCFNGRNKCQTCAHGGYCDFKENPIGIPPMIQQTVRQGNAVMTTQVPNPERIKATCMANCKCFCEEGCNRQCGTCRNYDMKYVKIEKNNNIEV